MTELVPTRAVLLADIGGTNSRFALAGPDGRPERIMVVADDLVADLESAIARYLDETGARPRAAVLAVAAPIDGGDEIALTNRPWRFRRSVLTQRFGLAKLHVVNDFEAIAWALTRLTSADVRPLGRLLPEHEGVKAVLGPGTGLGVAALIPVDGRWHVLASEGGHASFGPQATDEMDIFARLARDHGAVSAETVLSGPGLPRLLRSLDPQSRLLTPEAIVASALAGEPSAQATVRLFVRLLGRFAGGIALTFKAVGGVYIAGGLAASLGTLFDERVFRAAFDAHPPYEQWLQTVPTLLVSRAEPGLFGCAVLADEFAAASD